MNNSHFLDPSIKNILYGQNCRIQIDDGTFDDWSFLDQMSYVNLEEITYIFFYECKSLPIEFILSISKFIKLNEIMIDTDNCKFKELIIYFPNLERLTIGHYNLPPLKLTNSKLKYLKIYEERKFYDVKINKIELPDCLEEFEIEYSDNSFDIFYHNCHNLINLKKLNLIYKNEFVVHYSNLNKIKIDIEKISLLKELEEITFTNYLPENFVEIINFLPKVKCLNINHMKNIFYPQGDIKLSEINKINSLKIIFDKSTIHEKFFFPYLPENIEYLKVCLYNVNSMHSKINMDNLPFELKELRITCKDIPILNNLPIGLKNIYIKYLPYFCQKINTLEIIKEKIKEKIKIPLNCEVYIDVE